MVQCLLLHVYTPTSHMNMLLRYKFIASHTQKSAPNKAEQKSTAPQVLRFLEGKVSETPSSMMRLVPKSETEN